MIARSSISLLTCALGALLTGNVSAQEQLSEESTASVDTSDAASPQVEEKTQSLTETSSAGSELSKIPKDPNGIQGISPFWESIHRGDAAYAAHNYEQCEAEYKAAITSQPQKAIGHLRMAELSWKQAKWEQAQEFAVAALRFSQDDLRSKIAASHLLALINESQLQLEAAQKNWEEYKELSSQVPAEQASSNGESPQQAQLFIESAESRIKASQKAQQMRKEYKLVKERIAKNLEAATQTKK